VGREVRSWRAGPGAAELHAHDRDRIGRESPDLSQVRFNDAAIRVRDGLRVARGRTGDGVVRESAGARAELRQQRPYRARVLESASGTRAPLHGEPVPQTRDQVDIDALPVLDLLREVARRLRELVNQTDLGRDEVIQAGD